MKRLLLLSIVITAQQHATEPNDPVKKPVEFSIRRIYTSHGKTVVPFIAKKPENAPIAQASEIITKIVSQEAVSADVASIIAKVEAIVQSKKNKKDYTPKEIQQTKNACFRALKKTTNAYERSELAKAYAKFA